MSLKYGIISKKMKNGFAMMSGSDEPLGACHSIIIDEQAPRCWLIAIHHPFRAYIIANRKSSRKILKNICLNIYFVFLLEKRLRQKKLLVRGDAERWGYDHGIHEKHGLLVSPNGYQWSFLRWPLGGCHGRLDQLRTRIARISRINISTSRTHHIRVDSIDSWLI